MIVELINYLQIYRQNHFNWWIFGYYMETNRHLLRENGGHLCHA